MSDDSDGFIRVSRKRSRKKWKNTDLGNAQKSFYNVLLLGKDVNKNDLPSVTQLFEKIKQYYEEIRSSEYFKVFRSSLGKALSVIDVDLDIKEIPDVSQKKYSSQNNSLNIVCYGLGSVCNSTSCYQFGLLLCMKNIFNANVSVYDPLFTSVDKEVMNLYDCDVIDRNEEGKRSAASVRTIFYMPHCGKPLYNNLLWSNWSCSSLKNIIIIGNSFKELLMNTVGSVEKHNVEFIRRIAPYVEEFSVLNKFRLVDVFSSLSIHVFKAERLLEVPGLEWNDCVEPVYESDSEIITALQTFTLS